MQSNKSHFFNTLAKGIDNGNYQHVITWNPAGTGFLLQDLSEFSNTFLKTYFPGLNIETFISKMKKIGFKVIKSNTSVSFELKGFCRLNSIPNQNKNNFKENPSRKKSFSKNPISTDLAQIESWQHQMEQKVSNLETKFKKIISLNIYLINELNKSSQNEKTKYSELLKHLKHFTESNS